MLPKKSTLVAYLLYFCGGVFGAHLLYVKRTRQAVLYSCTFGCFGMGLIYDLFVIPRYIWEANLEYEFIQLNVQLRQAKKRPDINWERAIAEVLFGWICAFYAFLTIPDETLKQYQPLYYFQLCIVGPFGAAFGVFYIGGIGCNYISFSSAFLGAFFTIPFLVRNEPGFLMTSFGAAFWGNLKGLSHRGLEDLKGNQMRSYKSHLVEFAGMLLVIYSLLFIALFNNATIRKDGEEIPLRIAMKNFLSSQAWKDLKASIIDFASACYREGLSSGWSRFVVRMDPLGEAHAAEVLGFDDLSAVSEADIDRRCRQLLKENHPDRFHLETDKNAAQEKFLEVQSACDTLSQVRRQRKSQNRMSVQDTGRDEL